MLKTKILDALNKQLNEEQFSSYLYLSMSAWFETKNLTGFAHWMKVQSEEEYLHASKFFQYICSARGEVKLQQINQPKLDWTSIEEAIGDALHHEMYITECINDLATLASEEKDHATLSMLKFFIDEQVEEVATVEQILAEIKMVENDKNALFTIDRELKTRPVAIQPVAGITK